jgi:hypothetical protein
MSNVYVSPDAVTLRSAAALTTSFVASSTVKMVAWNQAVLFLDYTKGSSDDARIMIDVACTAGDDASAIAAGDWHTLPLLDTASAVAASGVATVPLYQLEYKLTATGTFALPVPCNYKWLRVRAKATTDGTGTSLTIKLVQGIA